MASLIHSTAISDADWRKHCLEWAKAKQEFQVLDYDGDHFRFCERLCIEYGYAILFIIGEQNVLTFRRKQASDAAPETNSVETTENRQATPSETAGNFMGKANAFAAAFKIAS